MKTGVTSTLNKHVMKKAFTIVGGLVAAWLISVQIPVGAAILVGNLGLGNGFSDAITRYPDPSASSQALAQSFQINSPFNLSFVLVRLQDIDSGDPLVAQLWTHDSVNNAPSAPVAQATFTLQGTIPTADFGDVRFNFDRPDMDLSDQPYWLVLNVSTPGSQDTAYSWGRANNTGKSDGPPGSDVLAWSLSIDDGAWDSGVNSPGNATSPFKLEVNGTAVPEPAHYAAAVALGLCAFGVGREVKRRRSVRA